MLEAVHMCCILAFCLPVVALCARVDRCYIAVFFSASRNERCFESNFVPLHLPFFDYKKFVVALYCFY